MSSCLLWKRCTRREPGIAAKARAVAWSVSPGSLTTLREKLVKIGAKVVRHSASVIFQLAEVAVPRELFKEILRLIARLRAPPAAT